LRSKLPAHCELLLGPVQDTVPIFLRDSLSASSPPGFEALDLDYYSSTKQALALLADTDSSKYLFLPILYFDEIVLPTYNEWAGELLAVKEFNAEQ
jgi:hypothetical protein